jgi:hypothetical protein
MVNQGKLLFDGEIKDSFCVNGYGKRFYHNGYYEGNFIILRKINSFNKIGELKNDERIEGKFYWNSG